MRRTKDSNKASLLARIDSIEPQLKGKGLDLELTDISKALAVWIIKSEYQNLGEILVWLYDRNDVKAVHVVYHSGHRFLRVDFDQDQFEDIVQ